MLPDIHEIHVEFDGRTIDGSWYVMLGDMLVYYNGHAASTPRRGTDADEVAMGMLRELVEKHCVRLESLPVGIPDPIRRAAHEYVNTLDDEPATRALIASWGEATVGSPAHRQLSWLCVNSIAMIVPTWKYLCDGNAAEETFNDLARWLHDPGHPVDWEKATIPAIGLRDGIPIRDCDACRLEPTADAVAATARYLQSADPDEAVAALLSASAAYDEGCHPEGAPDRFEHWLVFEALAASLGESRQPQPDDKSDFNSIEWSNRYRLLLGASDRPLGVGGHLVKVHCIRKFVVSPCHIQDRYAMFAVARQGGTLEFDGCVVFV